MSRNNMFDDAADKRKKEQSEITAHVTKKTDRSMKMSQKIEYLLKLTLSGII